MKFLFALLALLPLPGLAQTTEFSVEFSMSREFREPNDILEMQYLRAFRQKRVTNFGGFPLAEFLAEAPTVKFRIGTSPFHGFAGSGLTRFDALNSVKNRTVFFAAPTWPQIPQGQVKGVTVLHETLGALGWDDEDYSLSLGLDDWVRNGTDSLAPASVGRSFEERSYQSFGGTTVVGGGGSQYDIYLKTALLQRIHETELRREILRMEIICDWNWNYPQESLQEGIRISWHQGRLRLQTRGIYLVYAMAGSTRLVDYAVKTIRELSPTL